MIGVAAQRGLDGACLLGEIPFYAVGVPNPRASLEVVRLFQRVSGIDIDTSVLESASEAAEPRLLSMQAQVTGRDEDEDEPWQADDASDEHDSADEPELDARVRREIEQLFEAAERDRTQAVRLKRLLDEHGVFDEYEDRFLDLFKKTD